MRYVIIVVAVLVGAVLLVAVIGWSLPVKHRASNEATYSASPDTIFALLTHVADFPTWRSGITRVEVLPDEDGHSRFREVSGRDRSILYSIESVVPDQQVVTRIADPKLPFGGTWTYDIVPTDHGTTLRITEDGEVYNPIFRFVSRFVMGQTSTIDRYLADVGKRVGR